MGARGDRTKSRIISAARDLFSEKGFSAVTMKDICDEAEMSRGGLYRYFSSTEEIFMEIINREQQSAFNALARGKNAGASATVIIKVFIKHRINTLLGNTAGVDNAVTDFAANNENGRELITRRADNALSILTDVISLGCQSGEFRCDNARSAALAILCLIEGLNKHNTFLKLSVNDIKAQEDIIMHSVLGVEG